VRAAVRRSRPAAILLIALAMSAAQLTPIDKAGYAKLISSYRGKVLLVDFWATWCEPCREELPRLVAMAAKLDASRFALVTISADEPEKEATAAAFLDREHAPASRYLKRTEDDEAFINSVDKEWSGALPALFLYDAGGKLIGSFIGESDPGEVEQAVRKAYSAR
jgi:thiol-disulfide isomerase/thioredoxin